MNKTILEMRDIKKSFYGSQVLKGVNLCLKKGEILALCGANGAGKSTLIKILCGVYPYGDYSGKLFLMDKKMHFSSPKSAGDAGIQLVAQEITSFPELTVAENIFMGNIPKKHGITDWKRMNIEARTHLELVGLKCSPETKMKDLTMSEAQLVSIARALSRKPEILVLDEPTSSLTELESELLFSIIKKMAKNGISLIYISHKMKEVMNISDRICVLRDGYCVLNKETSATEISEIAEAMVNRKIDTLFPQRKSVPSNELLSVKNLRIIHPENRKKKIIRGIDFSVKKGEIIGLVGLTGSGRSEILNSLCGNMECRTDGIIIFGRKTEIKCPRDAIKNGMILLSENRGYNGFVPTLNISENITLASLKKISSNGLIKKDKELSYGREYIEKLSVKSRSEKALVTGLSGGNQQKVILAKCLMASPKILLLDEPTRGIDIAAKMEIYEIITELADNGVSIIIASSEMSELIGLCDRFLLLCGGKIAAELSKDEADEKLFLQICSGGAKSENDA